MLLRFACLLGLFCTTSLSMAADKIVRPQTAYGVLYQEWKAEVKALDAADPALPGPEKRNRKRDINTRYTPRFLALAQAHPTDDLWLDCLIWTSGQGVPGTDFDAMFDLLRDNAPAVRNDIQLQLLMSEFISLDSSRINPALASISETHKLPGMRGAALYALAARTKQHAEEHGDIAGCAAAEKLLERVIAEYPHVSTYRGENHENATPLLDELRSPVAIGKSAPHTTGKTLSGESFDLNAATRGKVTVISFSGHWCVPCVAMHPIQKEILAKFPRDQVVIVEMNSDPQAALDRVREKVAADNLGWTIITDGREGPAAKQWQITSWPTYFVIDPQGHIRRRASGNLGPQLITWVEELLPASP